MSNAYLSKRPREEVLLEIVSNLHARWRLVIFVPMVYLILGLLIVQLLFIPRMNGEGFHRLSDSVTLIVIFLGGAMVMFLWYLLERMRIRMVEQLIPLRGDPAVFLSKAREHQMIQFLVCDLAASPGIVLFFLNGTIFPPVLFVFGSMIFYLRTLPSEYLLGRAFLLPEKRNEA